MLNAGDVMLLPSWWAHATLTLAETVAIGASLGGAPILKEEPPSLKGLAAVRDPMRVARFGVERELAPWVRRWLEDAVRLHAENKLGSEDLTTGSNSYSTGDQYNSLLIKLPIRYVIQNL